MPLSRQVCFVHSSFSALGKHFYSLAQRGQGFQEVQQHVLGLEAYLDVDALLCLLQTSRAGPSDMSRMGARSTRRR